MEGIAVIVANDRKRPEEVERATSALLSELETGIDEVVWVDRAGLEPPADGFVYVRGPAGSGRGHLYALGLRHTTRDVAVFTDSTTVVVPGWRRAILSAFSEGAVVAGGPVLPSLERSRHQWACFFAEYGFHAVPPYTNSAGDVSANNVAYARRALKGLGGPLWKSEIDRRLMERGLSPVVVPDMRVVATKLYPRDWLLRERVRQGSLYAAQRSRGWSRSRRLAYAAATSLLPAVLFTRLAKRIDEDPRLRSRFWACSPLVFFAMIMWSVGEALGALGWKDPHVEPF